MKDVRYGSEKVVNSITGRALSTLRNDRHKRKGIPYIKFGRSVLYDLRDVEDFMQSRKIKTEQI